MNAGRLNKRIKFIGLSSTDDGSGGSVSTETDLITTWGALEAMNMGRTVQQATEAGISVLNETRILIIRYRASFTPTKDMLFVDMDFPDEKYTIVSSTPYWPGSKTGFEAKDDVAFQNKRYIYILGVKRD